jgi:hypothetical protein
VGRFSYFVTMRPTSRGIGTQPGSVPERNQGLRVVLHEKHCGTFLVVYDNEISHILNISPYIKKLPGGAAERNQRLEFFLRHKPCDKFSALCEKKPASCRIFSHALGSSLGVCLSET